VFSSYYRDKKVVEMFVRFRAPLLSEIFRHSLWMVPGVKEAKGFKFNI
jgi:hypothetical protein